MYTVYNQLNTLCHTDYYYITTHLYSVFAQLLNANTNAIGLMTVDYKTTSVWLQFVTHIVILYSIAYLR